MGQAIDFAERNDYIGKPPSMTDNQCYSLPVCRIVTHIPGESDKDEAEQTLAHVSFWQFSDEEIEAIVKNRGAYVKILGSTLYPMSVHGIKPIYPGKGKLCDVVLTQDQITAIKRKN
jgi:hypothetical protein